MEARELRIGNWVQMPVQNGEVIEYFDTDVYKISYDEDTGLEFVNDFETSDLRPIPLAEEWLVKFGFFKTPTMHFKSIKNLHGEDVFYFELPIVDGDFFYYAKTTPNLSIQYVHQLQNLYFALTGQELTIK